MPPGKTELTTPLRLTAGAMAGITSVVMTYPLDITRTRLSVQSSSLAAIKRDPNGPPTAKLPGMFPTIARIYRTEGGIPALYRGLVPTVMGVAPYVGLNFAVYEHMRKVVTPQGQRDPSAFGKLLAGGISGAVAQTVTYPMDVLRRRFQVWVSGDWWGCLPRDGLFLLSSFNEGLIGAGKGDVCRNERILDDRWSGKEDVGRRRIKRILQRTLSKFTQGSSSPLSHTDSPLSLPFSNSSIFLLPSFLLFKSCHSVLSGSVAYGRLLRVWRQVG